MALRLEGNVVVEELRSISNLLKKSRTQWSIISFHFYPSYSYLLSLSLTCSLDGLSPKPIWQVDLSCRTMMSSFLYNLWFIQDDQFGPNRRSWWKWKIWSISQNLSRSGRPSSEEIKESTIIFTKTMATIQMSDKLLKTILRRWYVKGICLVM